MRIGPNRGFPHPAKEFLEIRIAGKIGAQHQSVNEESDKVFEFCAVPPRDGGAHNNVFLSGVTREQDIECAQKGHEQSAAPFRAQFSQTVQHLARNHAELVRPLKSLHRRPGAISGQL